MYKVKVLRKFCDEDGVLHPCFEQNSQKQFIYNERGHRIPVIKEMSNKAAEYAIKHGYVEVLEKPEPKPKAKAKKNG